MAISFEYGKKEYCLFDDSILIKWIEKVIGLENYKVGEVLYHFVSEDEILKINLEYLNHDYFTDIITFDEVFVNIINGDIFISPDTIKTNSQKFDLDYHKEYLRVIIHGIMHLCGHKDATNIEKEKMRGLEEKYLSYLEKL